MRKSYLLASATMLGLAGSSSAATLTPLSTFGGGDGYIATGERPYLTTGDVQRGMAYNPVTKNVYVLSRNTGTGGAPEVAILDGATGAEISRTTLTGITGGTFLANKIRVAEDGAIYVSNLNTATSGSSFFKIYRYGSESALTSNSVTTAFSGTLTSGARYGDIVNIRGTGSSTQIVAGGGINNNDVVVFTTADGSNFNANVFDVGGSSDNQRLGIAFGEGDTIWAKGSQNLVRIGFTIGGSASILNTFGTALYPSGSGPLDVDPDTDHLIPMVYGAPDNTRLYDISDPTTVGVSQLLDTENWPSPNNSNASLLGDVDTYQGMVYALNTNDGIAAYYIPEPASLSLLALGGVAMLRRRK